MIKKESRFMFTKTAQMHLVINANKLIKDVQQEFTSAFPYLKIEFFRNGEVRKDRYPATMLIAQNRSLKDAWSRKKEEGELDIPDTLTVGELENLFMDRFGLSVQVFRRSGNLWLETTMTDNWTLKQQNDHGKEISASYTNEKKGLD